MQKAIRSALDGRPRIDAKTFQEPLAKLAKAISELVKREGSRHLTAPEYVSHDIFMMIRHALATYNFLFYLNADERREKDFDWSPKYLVVTAPVIRTMIDCLYNVTAILQNPGEVGIAYRKAGLKKRLNALKEDAESYRGRQEWEEHIAKHKDLLDMLIRASGFKEDEILAAKSWQTLGAYISGDGKPLTPHREFLKTFTYGHWRQYSALSHGGFEGYIAEPHIVGYLAPDILSHDERPKMDATYDLFLTRHIGRAAAVLLSLVTEIQAHFLFDGADINNRIQKMWEALMGLFEAKELYDEHYYELMKKRGMVRP